VQTVLYINLNTAIEQSVLLKFMLLYNAET